MILQTINKKRDHRLKKWTQFTMEWIFCNKIADMSVSYFGISGGSRDVRASLTVRKVCSRGGSSSSPRLWPADTSAGHFLKKQPPQEIILHTALLFTDGWLSLLPALPLLICQLSEGLAGRTEEGWSGPVKVEGSTEARSVCVCRRQAERLPRFSPGAPPVLPRCSHRAQRAAVRASEAMGCGLRKLEDPEDCSPGKIYSTLKRPQVETKTDTVYEYVLLDFSLEGRLPVEHQHVTLSSCLSV